MKKALINHQGLRNAYAELNQLLDMDLLKSLTRRLNGKTYLFGGYIRDYLLGIAPNDVDFICVVGKNDFARAKTTTEKFLSDNYFTYQQATVPNERLVFRFTINSQKDKTPINVDFAITPVDDLKIASIIGTSFTLNSLYVDVVSGEAFDLFDGISDLRHRIIRASTIADIKKNPHLLFRAIYLAAKLPGFSIDPTTLETIQILSKRSHLTLAQMSAAKNPILRSHLRQQVFGGLKYNQKIYLELMEKSGLLDQIEKFVQKNYGLKKPAGSTNKSYILQVKSLFEI